MRQTAKRLLFIFGVLSLSSLWSPAALAGYTDPLDELFQSSAYQEGIPEELHFYFSDGSEMQRVIANHTLVHVPALKAFQITNLHQDFPKEAPKRLGNPTPETSLKELLTALEEGTWSLGVTPQQTVMFICYFSYLDLSFKLKDGRSFSISSNGFAPSHFPVDGYYGPWILKLDFYEYETYDPNIGKAILKIFHQL